MPSDRYSPTDTIPAPPRRRRKEARPGEILEAGFAEFAARGFAATRLDDVARRAGIAKGTIYRYFDDKEALFIAVVRSRVMPAFDDAGAFVDGFRGTTRDLLGLVIRRLYARIVDGDMRVLMRIVIAEAANFPVLVDLYHRETVSRGRALVARIVARGLQRGEVRPGPAAELPVVLMAPAMMAVIWKLTFDTVDPIPTEAFLAAHLDLIFDGICTK